MKAEVKELLKERGTPGLFTNERYDRMKLILKYATSKDKGLKCFLSLDVYNRASWIVDHLVLLVNKGLM
jgi:hypothetical protein